MSVEIVMPQMGESITEGTISKWLKKVGDTVEKDEAILEISTDKVDAEVPSSGAGTLLEIRHQEGETVEVGTVLAVVGDASASSNSGNSSQISVEDVEAPKVEETKPEPVAETPKVTEEVKPVEVPQTATATASATPSDSPATEIVMPQMGESITEGTISKWLKKVGDTIEKDEAILEISTDKVDAEVPSLVGGTLLEIRHQEGETVEVGTVLALVGSGTGSSSQTIAPVAETPKAETVKEEPKPVEIPKPATIAATATASATPSTLEHLRQTKSSPLVRNIAKEHGVDISRIAGSGISGRVTKKDILNFLDTGAALKPEDLLVKPITPVSTPKVVSTPQVTPVTTPATVPATGGDRVETMSTMRKKIAEHMTFSKQTSAHVTSVYEIDMTNVVKFREKNKAAFAERFGTKLTFMPFIFQAVTQALRKYPVINSQVSGDKIIYKNDINLGIAVALDWGLIVPVIRQADTLSLSGLTIKANDLAERARTKKLNPDEVQGGTFTITNTGTFGGLFGTPIINQPQVAILNFGTIEKRPKVITTTEGEDYIAIRSMAYFALTYDHRIVDGADAEKFLSLMKNYLETNQFSL
ncbi:MAG: 2-oxoglutarate dehydrogenase, E2 component, dihydrolipoamide succinyltransferase [Pyrinomonadaceae bacterium]|nr:2-oxoglutarate dehydrogenase, E2 component, dihydrolipoamide succinyltransferase [Pyrinomonadaceae bacterium]